jgi:predicted amidohydrolase YtcJ
VTLGPDLVLRRARVWTDGRVLEGLQTLVVSGGHVTRVTPDDGSPERRIAGARVIDAAGASVTPGLHDAHLHVLEWARSEDEIDLTGCRTRDEVLARVASHPAANGSAEGTIVGRGWDANGWDAPPDRSALDRVTGATPAVLHSRDFHAVWVNRAALERCGIDRGVGDPSGGRIVRDAAGEPTGLLLEHAVRLVAVLARRDPARDERALTAAVTKLHAAGITSIHDFEGAAAHRLLRELTRGDAPRLRVLMHVPHAQLDTVLELGLSSGTGDDSFRLGAVKLFADGTLTSRTAAMLEPYEGTDERGMDLLDDRELSDAVRRAFEGGWSVAVHAIGDRAARRVLDAFDSCRAWIPRLALPPRIEHLQLVDPADLPRFAALGVAASMQPQHATTDAVLAERHWGRRTEHSYPWRAMLDHGALLAFGSDAPVEPPRPAWGLHDAMVRRGTDGEPFSPSQRITLDEALLAYTRGAAMLGGSWPRLGSVRAGACADLIVWDRDLDHAGEDTLRDARPVATLIAGNVVWEEARSTSRDARSTLGSAAPNAVVVPERAERAPAPTTGGAEAASGTVEGAHA